MAEIGAAVAQVQGLDGLSGGIKKSPVLGGKLRRFKPR
jgi:hypothetical protein